jgi:diadenylate cyclase
MSENSDAIVIVVSEETGAISVAENGTLTSGFTRERLWELLQERLIAPQTPSVLMKASRRFSSIKNRKGRDDS